MKNQFLIIFLLLSYSCFSQVSKVNKNEILIGDAIQLSINCEFANDEEYIWPELKERTTIWKNFYVKGINKKAEEKIKGSYRISQDIFITSFDTGTFYIPTFIFNSEKQTDSILINVRYHPTTLTDSTNLANLGKNTSSLPDISEIKKGSKNDLSEEELKKKWLISLRDILIIILIIVILILLFLIYKYYKKRKGQKPKKIVDEDIIALENLQILKTKKLWENGKIKEYHSSISEILRTYIEHRFQFNALEIPTNEIISKLNILSIDKEYIVDTNKILSRADNIKYAKGLSLEKENKESMEISIKFIKKTSKKKHNKND